MDGGLFFGVSLTASFIAGVLALFAPCCITFLFPSYLGTIFKENKKVTYFTLIFALGIAFVLVPIALGIRYAIFFLDAYHQWVYYFGALIMILMGVMTLWPVLHLPQLFHTTRPEGQKINTISVFGLGLMSGLTSACCAPVLFAAITLTSLAPSILQAIIVSFSYVLGIVMPLFFMSMFYKTATMQVSVLKRQNVYKIIKYIGAGVFFITGILIAIFNYQGKIVMNQMESYSQIVQMAVFNIARYFQNPVIDLISFIVIITIFVKLLLHNGGDEV